MPVISGSDAERGLGLKAGTGVRRTDQETGLELDLSDHVLVVHEGDGFRDRGVSVSLSLPMTGARRWPCEVRPPGRGGGEWFVWTVECRDGVERYRLGCRIEPELSDVPGASVDVWTGLARTDGMDDGEVGFGLEW